MSCRCPSWTLSQYNSRNFSRKFLTFCLAVSRTSCIYFGLLEALILVSLKDLEIRLRRYNKKKGCISALHKNLRKGGVKKRFILRRNLRREFTLSITFKAIDSPERLSSKVHPAYSTFTCCLISIPLYAIFKDLAFRGLCLVTNNIDLVFPCPSCILNLFSTNQSRKLKQSLISRFSISITLLCLKNIQALSVYINEVPTTPWGEPFM